MLGGAIQHLQPGGRVRLGGGDQHDGVLGAAPHVARLAAVGAVVRHLDLRHPQLGLPGDGVRRRRGDGELAGVQQLSALPEPGEGDVGRAPGAAHQHPAPAPHRRRLGHRGRGVDGGLVCNRRICYFLLHILLSTVYILEFLNSDTDIFGKPLLWFGFRVLR